MDSDDSGHIDNIYNRVFADHQWKPIHNCPGRFTFPGGSSSLTAQDIIGIQIKSQRFVLEKIPDEVIVAEFKTGGGLISYVKGAGKFLHTLNDKQGFARKLEQLEIIL